MKKYAINEVAQFSGVSVRTLHYYDKIGLLKPLNRSEAGYRYYGEQELLRLQQILFYKELDFSLKEIQDLLDDPQFDLLAALQDHRSALENRKERISKLLNTIDTTITNLKNENVMSNPKDLYEGLPKEMGTTHRNEAIEKYGPDQIDQAEKYLLSLGKKNFKQLQADFERLNKDLFDMRNIDPESEFVQEAIGRHYQMIRQFWGTTGSEDKQAEAYAGLGQLYINDERFTMVNGEPQPEFAAFLQKAMRYFADNL